MTDDEATQFRKRLPRASRISFDHLRVQVEANIKAGKAASALLQGMTRRFAQMAKAAKDLQAIEDDRSGHEKAEEEYTMLEAQAGNDT